MLQGTLGGASKRGLPLTCRANPSWAGLATGGYRLVGLDFQDFLDGALGLDFGLLGWTFGFLDWTFWIFWSPRGDLGSHLGAQIGPQTHFWIEKLFLGENAENTVRVVQNQ